MAFKQAMYIDFSGALNDTVAALSIADKEVSISENADYSAEVKGIKTSKGCIKVNDASYAADIPDGYSWTVGSTYKKCVVKAGKLYDLNITDGSLTEKITLSTGAKRIYPFTIYNKLYFGDGSKLYVWGDYDHASDTGIETVEIDEIAKNNHSSVGQSVVGNFYKALVKQESIDLKTQDYSDATKWANVTDVRYMSSSVVREVSAFNPAQAEQVLVTITSGASASGTVSIVLDGTTFTFGVTASDSAPTVVDKMYAMTSAGWTKTKISNGVKFTKDTTGISENGYLDPSTTGITATYETLVEGKDNDNDLSAIKKCTMFTVHPGSFRVFAAGNPEDNALYYSEIGNPAYFKSNINKVYPAGGYGKVTAMIPLSESVIVSYENGWYSWNGITPLTDAVWKPLNLPYGCVCHESLVLTPYSFTFLARDGIYNVGASILNSDVVMIRGKDVIKKITEGKVENVIRSINDNSMCRGIFYNNVYYLAYNTDGIANDKVLKYEFDTKGFTIKTDWIVNSWLFDPSNLYFASKNYVLKANSGYADINVEDGSQKAVAFHVKLKEFSFGNPLSQKVLQFIHFVFKQGEADTSNVDIIVHLGYKSFKINGIDLAESLIWGRDWGKIWGFRESIIKSAEVIERSNTFQVEIINNNINDPITLIGVGFIYEESDLVMPEMLKDEVLLI